jgi:OOP family OmpA-OmpF porin
LGQEFFPIAISDVVETNRKRAILIQKGQVPLTNMLAPGAMGISSQVDSDKTSEGQAENRRVVVRILQNKGVSGT